MRADNRNIREDFLNYLIQLQQKKQLTDIDMAAHAMTFFFDGYETSSMVIANTLNQLARHPEVQDRLRKEIENVVVSDEAISYEQILDLKYLEQVINGITLDMIRKVICMIIFILQRHFELIQ